MKTKKVGIRKGNSFSLDKKNMRKSLKELIVSYFELQGLMDIISKSEGTFCTISTVDEIVK